MGYIAIVDYGAGNLMSVHNTLDYLGYENKIAASADVIENAAGVILPGVGAFPDAMAALTDFWFDGGGAEGCKGKAVPRYLPRHADAVRGIGRGASVQGSGSAAGTH